MQEGRKTEKRLRKKGREKKKSIRTAKAPEESRPMGYPKNNKRSLCCHP